MRSFKLFALIMGLLLCITAAQAETLEQTFSHQLKVGDQPRSWEHRINLPDSAAMKGRVFIARSLDLRMGKLVIEREEFTPHYYYVKVRLPKHVDIPMAGTLKVEITIGSLFETNAPAAPTALALSKAGATLKPVFTWKTSSRYAAISLFDLTEQKTVWERVSTTSGYIGFDEGLLKKDHRYRWAVKVSDANGRYSSESASGFRIEEQNGVVIAIPE